MLTTSSKEVLLLQEICLEGISSNLSLILRNIMFYLGGCFYCFCSVLLMLVLFGNPRGVPSVPVVFADFFCKRG